MYSSSRLISRPWLENTCTTDKLSRHTINLVPHTVGDDYYMNDYDDLRKQSHH